MLTETSVDFRRQARQMPWQNFWLHYVRVIERLKHKIKQLNQLGDLWYTDTVTGDTVSVNGRWLWLDIQGRVISKFNYILLAILY